MMTITQLPDQTTRGIRPLPRPFPRAFFDHLSGPECLHVLEILHFATHTERPEQAQDLLTQIRDRLSLRYALGGLIRRGPHHTFFEFKQIVNAGYPDEWLTLYCDHGLAERDPILKATLRAPVRTIGERSIKVCLPNKIGASSPPHNALASTTALPWGLPIRPIRLSPFAHSPATETSTHNV